MRPWLVLPVALAALAPLSAGGCGTDAYGVGECKQIEEARCRAAAKCPEIPLGNVVHASGTDVDACIRFYDVACLHGLVSGSDPGPAAVSACVAAISDHPCAKGEPNLVASPEKDPACSWLVPPASAPAADASEAAAEGGDAAGD